MKSRLLISNGFTLIEVTLALTVFSLMLLVVSKGVLGVVHIQQSGVGSRNTQQNARLALERVVREARSASDVRWMGGIPTQALCLVTAGGLSEYYVKADHRLYRGTVDFNTGFDRVTNTCINGAVMTSEVAITSTDVAVTQFYGTVTPAPPAAGPPLTPPKASINIQVATANHTAATPCTPGPGSQYCSTTILNSTVSLRGTP